MARTKDMTSGNPVKLILVFALPILAGNTLQQLYSLVDSLIIGRILGVTALTAVSTSGWLDWAVLSVPMGLAQGYSIHAAQCYGGKRTETVFALIYGFDTDIAFPASGPAGGKQGKRYVPGFGNRGKGNRRAW